MENKKVSHANDKTTKRSPTRVPLVKSHVTHPDVFMHLPFF